ncbi:SLC18B1_9 [Blepharisma stoltei]|uniref:Major facilitator superfamily (MFS) profile domain-containing protein n=1 Tax=Blepharisma stoltei TaxID=1481888 RepID=A0AAU9JZI7_9CILI|nr:unnamed protein product [Blepharisma stoltei]
MFDLKKITILSSNFLTFVAYGVLGPFFPKVADSKGVSQWTIGIIFSIVPIVSIPTMAFVNAYMYKMGRRFTYLISLFLQGVSMILLCFLESLDETDLVIVSVISRLILGVATGFIWVSTFAIVTTEFKDHITEAIGHMESAVGLGLVGGPLIGTALYVIGGFSTIFITIGTVFMVFVPIAFFSLNHLEQYLPSQEKVGAIKLFWKPQIRLTSYIPFIVTITMGFMISSMALHLKDFGVGQEMIGVLFAVDAISYGIGGIIFSKLSVKIDKRIMMIVGLLGMTITMICMGPAPFLPSKLGIVIASLPLLGSTNSLTYVPSLPYMIEKSITKYNYEETPHLSDALSSIVNISFSVGEALGNIGAGIMVDFIGFEYSTFIISILIFVLAIIFLLSSEILVSPQKTIKVNEDDDLMKPLDSIG